MNLEINGKVIQKNSLETGTTKTGKSYQKQYLLIETQETYPKKVNICFFGDKADLLSNVYNGAIVTVSVNVESKEYNGRWYTEVNGWKVNMESQPAQTKEEFMNELADQFVEDDQIDDSNLF